MIRSSIVTNVATRNNCSVFTNGHEWDAEIFTVKINIPFHIAEDPLHSVAKGAGIALKNVDRFSFLMR